DPSRPVPIGRAVANTRLHVLDGAMHPVPPAVTGELYIGGVQVGRGYLGRPGVTAGQFVPHAFSPEPGGRLYRTRGRARLRPDGAIEYAGRFDHQVKVRGFRIEPGEIETALLAHPALREAVVVARDARLVAYVAAAEGAAAPEAAELRAHLGATLPDY